MTWQSGGGPAADNFTLYYRAKTAIEWNVLKGIKDRTVTLQGLKTYTTYLCRVFAVNGAGISRPSPLSEFTTGEKGFYFFYFINYMNMNFIQLVKQYKKAISYHVVAQGFGFIKRVDEVNKPFFNIRGAKPDVLSATHYYCHSIKATPMKTSQKN